MAGQLFKRYSGGKTLHQLRHSRLTHFACELNQQNLDRKRRIMGKDGPSTLMSAHNLAADLSQTAPRARPQKG